MNPFSRALALHALAWLAVPGFAVESITITSAGVSTAVVNQSFSYQATYSGESTGDRWTASGPRSGLKLKLTTSSGLIYGNPRYGGDFRIPIAVKTTTPRAVSEPFLLRLLVDGGNPAGKPALGFYGNRTKTATARSPILWGLSATGNLPLTFTVENLPEGLEHVDGVISGKVSRVGTYLPVCHVSDTKNSRAATLQLIVGPASGAPYIGRPGGSGPTFTCELGNDINAVLAAAGSGLIWSAKGRLPDGVTLNENGEFEGHSSLEHFHFKLSQRMTLGRTLQPSSLP